MNDSDKIEYINSVLIELASGNFDVSCQPSDDKGELDAVIAGVDMLREELKYSTVSKSYLTSIYNGITDMLLVLNSDNTIQDVNDTVLDFLGFSSSELIGKHIDYLVDPSTKNQFEQLKFEALNKIKGNNFEFVFRKKNGGKIITSCSGSILVNTMYADNRLMLIAKDISDLKRTQKKLVAKNKELDTFVYKSSHDLKGPLASIIGLTNVAEMEVEDQAALNYFGLIKKSALRLDRILLDLSSLARLRNSATKISRVDLETLVEEVIGDYFLDTKLKNNLQVITSYDTVNDFYSNDKILLSVFQNIIGNAVKYRKVNHKSNSFLLVESKKKNNGVEVTIKDNGIGIPKDKIPKVFDMFERANLSADGSGLGLYIVKTSLDKIKGEISLTSEEGVGTEITIFMPSLKEIEEIGIEHILDVK